MKEKRKKKKGISRANKNRNCGSLSFSLVTKVRCPSLSAYFAHLARS